MGPSDHDDDREAAGRELVVATCEHVRAPLALRRRLARLGCARSRLRIVLGALARLWPARRR